MSEPHANNADGFDSYFNISARSSTVRQEVVPGLTTFLAMVYSVIVVPAEHVGQGRIFTNGGVCRHLFSDRLRFAADVAMD